MLVQTSSMDSVNLDMLKCICLSLLSSMAFNVSSNTCMTVFPRGQCEVSLHVVSLNAKKLSRLA